MKELSKTELIIMKCIWSAESDVSATEIMKKMHQVYNDDTDRHTLGTMIGRLEKEGYIGVSRTIGRSNLYKALVSENTIRRKKTREFLDWWYGGSIPALISALDEEHY